MLTPFLRLARGWLNPAEHTPAAFPMCVPDWSEPMAEHQAAIWWTVKPYTMASVERVVALCQSIAYIENRGVAGAIVECGVWKGGGVMAAALALLALESTQRQLYLYDTFAGMTEPGNADIDWQGRPARTLLRQRTPQAEQTRASCPLQAVKETLMQTRYPWEKFVFVPGAVEQTIPARVPDRIALMRLDTGWYESTYHELEHLYPRLADGGVLIVEEYGQWQGAKKAVDDYFRTHGIDAELRIIDFAGRLLIKRPAQALARAA